jgi:gluconokinase
MILLIMGVTGSGKSTVGRMLAERLGWVYLDADDFHSPSNKERMHRGIPLTETDRIPWLDAMHTALQAHTEQGQSVVLACSALRQEYRDRLMAGLDVKLIYLRGSRELIATRLAKRMNHFAGVPILDDQFAVLEEPHDAIVLDISETPEQIVEEILRKINITK